MPLIRYSRGPQAALCLVALLAGLSVVSQAQAQSTYPQKPVRLIVPFAPGGASDILARTLGQKLSETTGQSFVIENKPGAGGTLGAELVAKSAADGYTLLLADVAVHTIAPKLYPKLGYTQEQLLPVINLATFAHILITPPASTLKSFADVLALDKAKPGRFSVASSGNGTSTHLTIEMVNMTAATQLAHVPYKGGGQAMIDLQGGNITLVFTAVAWALPHIKAGRIKALGVPSATRSPSLPDTQTFIEAGLPNFLLASWVGILAPAKTPAAVITKLNTTLNDVLNDPDVKKRLEVLGITATPGTPKAYGDQIKNDLASYAAVVKAANIKPQ